MLPLEVVDLGGSNRLGHRKSAMAKKCPVFRQFLAVALKGCLTRTIRTRSSFSRDGLLIFKASKTAHSYAEKTMKETCRRLGFKLKDVVPANKPHI
jgi:hypothetical protein